MRGLEGRAFLVTGGGSGIGRGTCERLAEAGAKVAVVDQDGERAGEVVADLVDRDVPLAISFACDVGDEAQVEHAVAHTVANLGGLHGVVTSAGIFDPGDMQPLADVTRETFERVLAVNLIGTFLVLRHALPHLVDGGGGAVVTVASTAGLRGHGFGSGYTASKGGVIALTRLAAEQYGPHGVRANAVAPGATASEGMGAVFRTEDGAQGIGRGNPLRRPGQPEELGAAIAWLLSDEASYVSGQVIAVDGGATVR